MSCLICDRIEMIQKKKNPYKNEIGSEQRWLTL